MRTSKIAYALLALITSITILLLLSSCSIHQKAKRLLRQGYAKIERAKQLDPSVIDTVTGFKNIKVNVPGDSGSVKVEPAMDSTAFEKALDKYDSLNNIIDALISDSKSNTLTVQEYEDYLHKLKDTNTDLKKQKDRLIRGFAKDSTYTYEDSLQAVLVVVKDGQLTKIKHIVKPRTLTEKVKTTTLKLDAAPSLWKQEWFWIMGGFIILLLLIIIVLAKRR